MADNLTASIGINTGKFIADAAIIKKELVALRKELESLVKAGDTAGARVVGAQIATLTQRYNGLTREIRSQTQATRESTTAHHAEADSVRRSALEYGRLAREMGISVEGLKALKAGFSAFTLVAATKQITDAVNKVNELVEASKHIGVSTNALQSWEKAVISAGGSAEDARSALEGLSVAFAKTGRDAEKAGVDLDGATTIMHGAHSAMSKLAMSAESTTVIKGAALTKPDFADPIASILGIDRKQFGAGAQEFERFGVAVARAIVRVHDTVSAFKADEATKELFSGRTFAQLETALRKTATSGSFKALGDALHVRFLTPEEIEQSEKARQAMLELKDAWEALVRSFSANVLPNITPRIDQIRQALDNFVKYLGTVQPTGTTPWQDFTKGFDDFVTSTERDIEEIKRAWRDFIEFMAWVDRQLKAAHDALWSYITPPPQTPAGRPAPRGRGTPPAEGPQALPPEPGLSEQALGGYIRGPGSGTSDSILARLSNGEFVVNAGSVRRLGVNYLEALNSFAMGGLVGAPPIRFAEGGLASAASTPVHLHLGNQVFATSASASVASALVSEAHRQAMTSAGVKPSWYGGRPGGP